MTSPLPKISIVIPTKKVNGFLRQTIERSAFLDYDNFEILVMPDLKPKQEFPKAKIIPTGDVVPAKKRNKAAEIAQGDILAFLDDDAYPQKDWLKKAVKHFEDLEVSAVGGPAVTPETDSFWQKVSGAVFLSRVSGGNPERYWQIGKIKEIDDLPSVNLLVRKTDFLAVNGFNPEFWPGEDTLLCYDLTQKIKKKIIYDPDVLVYHHRRTGLKTHLKQVGGYGWHRGYFAKRFGFGLNQLKYVLPSLFFLFVCFGWVLLFFKPPVHWIYSGLWLAYGLALLFAFFDIWFKIKNWKIALFSLPYIFLTHIAYGYKFLQGLFFTKNLKN